MKNRCKGITFMLYNILFRHKIQEFNTIQLNPLKIPLQLTALSFKIKVEA